MPAASDALPLSDHDPHGSGSARTSWTFLTNHTHVLVCLSEHPELRGWEIARLVGIGERAVHSIVQDLVGAGYVAKARRGSHNFYEVFLDRPLRHPLESGHQIAEVFGPLTGNS
jgi:hypothetical protein